MSLIDIRLVVTQIIGFLILLWALRTEAPLSAVGRLLAYGQILKLLQNRLLIRDQLARHPEIIELQVVRQQASQNSRATDSRWPTRPPDVQPVLRRALPGIVVALAFG